MDITFKHGRADFRRKLDELWPIGTVGPKQDVRTWLMLKQLVRTDVVFTPGHLLKMRAAQQKHSSSTSNGPGIRPESKRYFIKPSTR